MRLRCANQTLDLSYPAVMGVINVTPDSFSDDGFYNQPAAALKQAERMVQEGAALIDVGGESTRPRAQPVSVQEELDRVLPVIEAIARELSVPISIDTSKPEVMQAAVRAGAGMINDTRALRELGALEIVSRTDVPVCLMHMQGSPATMQNNPTYTDVVAEVKAFLAERIQACEAAGIQRSRIIVDPGFGFGKTLVHNLTLLKRLNDFCSPGVPVLVGLSRKSTIGTLLDAAVDERLYGSLAAAVIAAWQGANIIRVHDVKATFQALQVCKAAMEAI